MIGCFQELCSAHPGDAHQAEDQQATVHLDRALRTEEKLGSKTVKLIITLSLLLILFSSSAEILNDSEKRGLSL